MDTSNQMPYPGKPSEKSSASALIPAIIIIILLILGGLYFFKERVSDTTNTATSTDADLMQIESDLNSLDTDQNEAAEIDGEFTATTTE
jgi:uncharacterized protein YxeA